MGNQHLRTHDNEARVWTCVTCGQSWNERQRLMSHLDHMGPYHNGECAHCGVGFETWPDHENHVKMEHNGVWRYRCGKCGEVFENMTLVRSHERTVHRDNGKVIKSEGMTQINKFICADCGIEKGSEQAMTRHRKYYHDGDPVPCKECNKTFPSQLAYSNHYKALHVINEIACEICGKVFKNKRL